MESDGSDLVVKHQILEAQSVLEDKARCQWSEKWGFYLDFDKMLIEEASKRGISNEEYRRRTVRKKQKSNLEPDIWEVRPSSCVPRTTTGFVGWRADKESSLEKFGPLYVSPSATLPYEPPCSCIFLG